MPRLEIFCGFDPEDEEEREPMTQEEKAEYWARLERENAKYVN